MKKATGRLRILLFFHRKLLSDLLRESLSRYPWIAGLNLVSGPAQALRLVRSRPPDVIMIDLTDSPEEGFCLAESLSRRGLGSRILFFSFRGCPPGWLRRVVGFGARGFVSGCARKEELAEAILSIGCGDQHFSPCVMKGICAFASRPDRFPDLLERETEVLALLGDGCTSKEIAQRLRTTKKAVDGLRTRLLVKTGTSSSAALVHDAFRQGLVLRDGGAACRCNDRPRSVARGAR